MCVEQKKYDKKSIKNAFQIDETMMIKTLEGDIRAEIGDYIITGTNGEQYPCKPDIFREKYQGII